jgi:hypothetical protein
MGAVKVPSPALLRGPRLDQKAAYLNRPRVRVRCLGPAKEEHTFLSADPRSERICPRCRTLQNLLRLSAIRVMTVSTQPLE